MDGSRGDGSKGAGGNVAPAKGKSYRVIGKPNPKVDAWDKCTGVTKFADDLVLPRMLHAKLLRSSVPHARIVRIDTSKAEKLRGVKAILTGKDMPIPYGILPVSQDEHALALEKVRMVGDPVAAIAAVDEDVATEAVDLIAVEYELLPAIASIQEALDNPETRIHEYGEFGNVHRRQVYEFGDVEAGFSEADFVREDLTFYEGSTHLPLEQHASLAQFFPDGKLTLWSSTQNPHYLHRSLAKVLE
ncbi:MAG: molybdopterin-dependent oxidoreductase, partial [Acidobacteria bacterium]|nr:molybdopterin-dependent oxidoreductase [Acidobacteriota bacterium]